jgi:PAS domain S-box-containing protein
MTASRFRAGLAFLLLFVLLAAGIVTTGYRYYRKYEKHYHAEVDRQLSIVADLKVSELVQWRKEWMGDASFLFKNAALSALVRRFVETPQDPDAKRLLQTWITKYQTNLGYARVFLMDTQGVMRMSAPEASPIVMPHLGQDAAAGLGSGQIAILDLHRDTPDGPVYMAIMVPIFGEQASRRPLGLIALVIDPASYLYPFIKRWPTPSRTAETLLVRREGNEALFLNELRFQTKPALTLRAPLDRTTMPAVQAALGREGIMEGIDYRGVPVVAALRTIPDSPWALVARMDVAEAYAPMREHLWQVVIMVGALLLGAGSCVVLIWWQQRGRFYREFAEMDTSVRRMATVVRDSNDAITIQDFAGRITAWNRGAELMYGYSEAEALLQNIERLTAPGKVDEQRDFTRRLVTGEAITAFETQRVAKDGRVLDVWLTVTKLMDAAGTPVGIASTERDITERKRAAEEVQRLNADLEQRVVERTAQLEEANKELESFSYTVSHDLHAPLLHVQGYVNMLAREVGGQLSERGRRYMKTIEDASRKMGVLIDDLLAFSRMGRADMSETMVNLDSLVQDTLGDLEPVTRERNIVWTIPPLPAVQADPAMLKLALTNLLSNAVKFTRQRNPAEIEIGCDGMEGERVILFVRDNGVGFDPQYAHKLFGVFQRLHRADEFEGTGIGLANVRRTIARQGGRVWAEGGVDRGATFYFTLKPSSTTGPVN